MMEDDARMADSIMAASQGLEADNSIALKDYYAIAGDLLKQADKYRKENNFIDLNSVLLRFSSLVLETIPSHKDFKSKHWILRHRFKKKAISCIDELESLKKIDELNQTPRSHGTQVDPWGFATALVENPSTTPSFPTIPTEQLTSQTSEKQDVDADEVASGDYSKMDREAVLDGEGSSAPSISNREAVLDGEGSSAPSISNSSSKHELKSDLHTEKTLSAIGRKGELKVDDVCAQLQHAIADIAVLKQEAFEDSCMRRKAEQCASEAAHSANILEKSYIKVMKERLKMEEAQIELTQKIEKLKDKRNELFQELQTTQEQKKSLETVVADLQDKLKSSQQLVSLLQMERDDALQEAEVLRKGDAPIYGPKAANVLKFSYMELLEATHNFDNSMKIGKGRYGGVYKGFLHNTTLTIKTVEPKCTRGQREFLQEVDILSSMRHPNLVNFIGICPESQCLIYEFLPNGNLEERLKHKGNSLPLSWQSRISIATEICSTLIFIHSCKPQGMIHGNLKPSNILFDAHFVSKIGDFRIGHQGSTTTTSSRMSSEEKSVYTDPEFPSTGKLTKESDVYSFGVILLRLLTGKSAVGIVEEVTSAVDKGNLQKVLDKSAGEWSFVQARLLVYLGLRCCQLNPKNRADLVDDAWRILEPLRRASFLGPSQLQSDDVPSYFLCPILQEIMKNPHVAADGFTYEAEAIRGWFDGGHKTSPMTNKKLPNQQLFPNHTLRSAIQEWFQQRGKQQN